MAPPTWSRTIWVAGNARARSTSSLELGVVHPRVEAETERRQPGEALAHLGVGQQARRPVDHRPPCRLIRMRRGDEADAAEAAAAGGDLRLQHPLDRRPQRQIGIADDAGANPCPAVAAGRAHRRHAIGELDLADRPHLGRTGGAIHRQPFEIDGRRDVMAAADIGQQIRQQIASGLGPIDQMMVRVDDRQIGLDDVLTTAVEPCRPDCQMRAGRICQCRRLHRNPSLRYQSGLSTTVRGDRRAARFRP